MLSIYTWGPGLKPRFIGGSSVPDPYHFDADPDPAFFNLMQIRILPFNLMLIRIRVLPLTYSQIWTLQWSKMALSPFYFDGNPDPDSAFSVIRIRIRIQLL